MLIFCVLQQVALTMALEFECSDPPLGVQFDIPYYSGKINCGSLMLKADIGCDVNLAPQVTLESIVPDAHYTLIMFDPDATVGGSWPDIMDRGKNGPVRHWVVGNIPAAILRSGNLSGATEISPFKGPCLSAGSHRYFYFLFEQPAGWIDFTPLPSDRVSLRQWDYDAFVQQYGLGDPVASNWHVTQATEPRNVTGGDTVPIILTDNSAMTIPTLQLECSDPPLDVEFSIEYYSGKIDCGNLMLKSDIGSDVNVPPRVIFRLANDVYYTLIMFDPDATKGGSWPLGDQGANAPVRHWAIGNIPGADLRSGDLSAASEISAFAGPGLKAGSHRYFYFLFQQPAGQIDFTSLPSNPRKWDYESFIADYGLGKSVASNWHVTQVADPRRTIGGSIEVVETVEEAAGPLPTVKDDKYHIGYWLGGMVLIFFVGAVVLFFWIGTKPASSPESDAAPAKDDLELERRA